MADPWKADLARIEQFLREWDPIGIGQELSPGGAAHEEYDSYAPRVLAALQRGVDERGLATALDQLERDELGLAPDTARNVAVASRILEWWNSLGVRR